MASHCPLPYLITVAKPVAHLAAQPWDVAKPVVHPVTDHHMLPRDAVVQMATPYTALVTALPNMVIPAW